jgi:hypothetical protein
MTRTKDEQDPVAPYKPFPNYEYFDILHAWFLAEPILFVEKSRTMMASWWAAAETLHYVMTHQPTKGIFWAQDEDRSLALLDYAWTLYEQQARYLKELFPLTKPRDRQSYKSLELAAGSSIVGLPGKDPNKIRSEHPTVLVIDEACFIENGGEAFDVAISSHVGERGNGTKVLVISSAAPSWFRRMTKPAVPVGLMPVSNVGE